MPGAEGAACNTTGRCTPGGSPDLRAVEGREYIVARGMTVMSVRTGAGGGVGDPVRCGTGPALVAGAAAASPDACLKNIGASSAGAILPPTYRARGILNLDRGDIARGSRVIDVRKADVAVASLTRSVGRPCPQRGRFRHALPFGHTPEKPLRVMPRPFNLRSTEEQRLYRELHIVPQTMLSGEVDDRTIDLSYHYT